MTKTVWGIRGLRHAVAMTAALAGAAAGAQQLYRCGASYQDRPCADREVQKRYAAGRFTADRPNPDTDKDCALEGTQPGARSQLESQCMAGRKRKGPTAAKNPG